MKGDAETTVPPEKIEQFISKREALNARRREKRRRDMADPEKRAKFAADSRRRYLENPERQREANRASYRKRVAADPKLTRPAALSPEERAERMREYRAKRYRDNRELVLQRASEYYHRNKARLVNASRRYYYRLTPEQFQAMLDAQGGACALCGKPHGDTRATKLNVDHNHETGEIRGLLCSYCNQRLSWVERKSEWKDRALAYLDSPPARKVLGDDHPGADSDYDSSRGCKVKNVRRYVRRDYVAEASKSNASTIDCT